MTVYVADHGPESIEIYTTDAEPVHVASVSRYFGRAERELDEALSIAGWVRVSAWHRSDDTAAGHRVATVEKLGPEDKTGALERLTSTLAAHLPAGTTITSSPLSWGNREVATFLAERLREAGYELVRAEVAQLTRDQRAGRERRLSAGSETRYSGETLDSFGEERRDH